MNWCRRTQTEEGEIKITKQGWGRFECHVVDMSLSCNTHALFEPAIARSEKGAGPTGEDSGVPLQTIYIIRITWKPTRIYYSTNKLKVEIEKWKRKRSSWETNVCSHFLRILHRPLQNHPNFWARHAQEAEAGGSWVWSQRGLHGKIFSPKNPEGDQTRNLLLPASLQLGCPKVKS